MLPTGSVDKVPLPPNFASWSYAASKSVAEGLLDFALLLANASQLRTALEVKEDLRTWMFWVLVVLLAVSLTMQIVTGVIVFVKGVLESESEDEEQEDNRIVTINKVTSILMGIITALNIAITGLGNKFSSDISNFNQTFQGNHT